MSNRPELSDLFLWMAIFINFVLNETPCDFSLLAGCRLCAGAYSGEFRLPVRPGVVSCHVFTAGNVLCEILDLLVKTGAETPQKQENATL